MAELSYPGTRQEQELEEEQHPPSPALTLVDAEWTVDTITEDEAAAEIPPPEIGQAAERTHQ